MGERGAARAAPRGRPSSTSSRGRATATRTAATCCSPRSWPPSGATSLPPSRASASSSRSACARPSSGIARRPLPANALRGHFRGGRRERPRGAGTLPCGRRRRALDHRARPRALGAPTSTRTSSPTAGCPSGSRQRGTLDDGTPIHYAWGLSVRTHRGPADREPRRQLPGLGVEDGALPDRAHHRDRAREPVRSLDVSAKAFRLADEALADRLDPDRSTRRRHLRRRLSAARSTASDPARSQKSPGNPRDYAVLRVGFPANPTTPGEVSA